MIRQTPGKIFLAEGRGEFADNKPIRFSTFNFKEYYHEAKSTFGNLYAFNEVDFAGGHAVTYTVEQDSYLLLIPVTGALNITFPGVPGLNSLNIEVEEILLHFVPANSTVTWRNPYPAETITFLHIWLKAKNAISHGAAERFSLKLHTLENNLAKVIPAGESLPGSYKIPFSLSLGHFAGRQEAVYKLENKASLFFAFVLTGAFELEGRLLHEKDGLALWNATEVELEALSNNALVMVLEQVVD